MRESAVVLCSAAVLFACDPARCGHPDLVRDPEANRCVCANGGDWQDDDAGWTCALPDAGVPVVDSGGGDACAPRTLYRDSDGDGFGDPRDSIFSCLAHVDGYVENGGDCDDACAECHPGEAERCDDEGRDEDCDGTANAGCECTSSSPPGPCGTSDEGACQRGEQRCVDGHYGPCEGAINPIAETCNGIDDDCDTLIDEAGGTTVYFRDRDGDSYGNSSEAMVFCTAPAGWAARGGDCADQNPFVVPGQEQFFADPIAGVPSSRDFDYDCDGSETSFITRRVSSPADCSAGGTRCGESCWLGAAPACGAAGDAVQCSPSCVCVIRGGTVNRCR